MTFEHYLSINQTEHLVPYVKAM